MDDKETDDSLDVQPSSDASTIVIQSSETTNASTSAERSSNEESIEIPSNPSGEKISISSESNFMVTKVESSKSISKSHSLSDNKASEILSPYIRISSSSLEDVSTVEEGSKLSSVSLPKNDGENEKENIVIGNKTPIIIRNMSELVFSQEGEEDEGNDNTQMEVEESPIVIGEEEIPQKTIFISQSPTLEKIKERKETVLDSKSSKVGVKRKSLAMKQAQESEQENDTTVAESSNVSPYNTRFAHMKVGPIFSICNRSASEPKRRIGRDNSKSVKENASKQKMTNLKSAKSEVEDSSVDSGVCILCGISFTHDMGISISVKKPLPLSKVGLMTLLDSFGIACANIKAQNLNQVHICNVCHTLVIEGDSAYKHLLTVASEMKEQWPYRIMKTNLVFSLTIPENFVNHDNTSKDLGTTTFLPINDGNNQVQSKRVRGRVGRPPKIKREEDDDDVNWKPSQVKLERPTHTGKRGRPPKRRLKKGRRGRPRKIPIKGEVSDEEVFTCALCSEEHFDENEWSVHYESDHRPQLRWVNFKLQKKLKKLILYNIQESFLNENFNDIMCHACDSKFMEKNIFLEHLRNFHKMKIDNEYITSLVRYSQGHTESEEGVLENDFVKEINAASDGTIIKIEKELLTEKSEKILKCKVCQMTLDSEKALKEHTDTNHFSLIVIGNDDSKEVVLPEAGEKPAEERVDDEVTDKENTDCNEFTCEECEDVFETRHKLLEHKLNIHGSTDDKGQEKGLVRYECEVCGRRIYGLAALKVHMTKVHYKTTSNFKFSCSMCLFKSQSRSQLVRHMRSKHEKEIMPSVQCETCGKMYGSSYIAKHIATMHSTHSRDYDCNFCDMKFFDMAGLKFHIYHEHANKVWKCSKCPMEFKKYHQLRQHRIFTHSTKVHACLECPKTYKRKSDLTEHIKRLHLQRVVLLCPRCPKQYVNRFKLRNHLMKHHDVPWEDTLARNYARHQRANNCRRTDKGVLEANNDQAPDDDDVYIQESIDDFHRKRSQSGSGNYDQVERQEYYDDFSRQGEEHEYQASRYGQHQQQRHPLTSVKMERDEPEEYIEIMEATDAFAKDGVTYVIIEETQGDSH